MARRIFGAPALPYRGRGGRAQQLAGQAGQLDQGAHHPVDRLVVSGDEALTEGPDAGQTGGSSTWTPFSAGRFTGFCGMETQPESLVGHVEAGEPVAQKISGGLHQPSIAPTHDDAGEGPGLGATHGRSIRVDYRTHHGVHPQSEAVPPEAVHRDGDLDMVEKLAEHRREVGVVEPGRDVHAEVDGLDDGVERGPGPLGGPARDQVRPAVLRTAVQRHEAHGGADDRFLLDSGQAQELREVHGLRMTCRTPPVPAVTGASTRVLTGGRWFVPDASEGSGPHVTLSALEDAIKGSWSLETCDPTDAPVWSTANPALGQCAATTLVVHDLLGGQLLEAEVHFADGSRQGFHYWNRLAGFDLDLTRAQFAADETIQAPHLIDRSPAEPWLAHEQYLVLRARVYAALGLDVPSAPVDAEAGLRD